MKLKGFYVTELRESDDFSDFSCGDGDLDDFIRNDAPRYQSDQYAFTYVARTYEHVPIAFYSVVMDGVQKKRIPEKDELEIPSIPCYKIARLAVDEDYRGMDVGETLLFDCIYQAKELSKQVGCRLVVVDSKPESVEFYLKYGFEYTAKPEKQKYPTLYLDLLSFE